MNSLKKRKIFILIYSTFTPPGYKGEQMILFIKKLFQQKFLGKCYGLHNYYSNIPDIYRENIVTTKYIQYINSILRRLFIFDEHRIYYIGESLLYYVYYFKIRKIKNQVVYLKPRPLKLVSKLKEQGNIVVLDSGECHPFYTKDICQQTFYQYQLASSNIYTRKGPVRDHAESLKLADHVIALNQFSKETFIRNGIRKEKIHCINLGYTGNRFNSVRKFNKNLRIGFMMVCNHSIVKGTHLLFDAWERYKDNSSCELLLIGDVFEDIKNIYSRYKELPNVKFYGQMNHDKIKEFYEKYNIIGLQPSLSEGYSRSTIEYLSNGVPVIVSPCATCDVVINNENGFIMDQINADSILNCLNLVNQSSYDRLSYNVFNTFIPKTQSYTEAVCDMLIDLCND